MNRILNRSKLNIRLLCCLIIAALVVTGLAGCGNAIEEFFDPEEAESLTASEELEELFTTIDLMDATIPELQTAMEEGHLTSERLTQMYIDRIEAYDKALDLNSIISINPAALDDARALDAERAEGTVRGPLHGIPIVVKANIDVEGMATSAGAKLLEDMVAEEDAFVIKKLKEQGAVILAQTNMSEFAYATSSSRSTLGGNTHNAYDTTKTPGGSSGGTAVAVTSNFAAAGIGTDTGGSIRNPASFSNLYGMRPSKGLVSLSGIFPLKAYKDTAGPLARTAEDMDLILEAMAGTDEEDDYTIEADADGLLGEGYTEGLTEGSLEGVRIGYLGNSFGYSAMQDDGHIYALPYMNVEPMLNETLDDFRNAGAELVDISDIMTSGMVWEFADGISAETSEYDINSYLSKKGDSVKYRTLRDLYNNGVYGTMQIYLDKITEWYAGFASSFEETYNPYTEAVGSYLRVPGWTKALEERDQISKIMEDNDIDCVMYLNFFDVAGEEQPMTETSYNEVEYDIVFGPKHGLPEISLPMGFSVPDDEHDNEMPLGLSLFSGFGHEETLLKIAYAYEQNSGRDIRRQPDNMPALEDEGLNMFLAALMAKAGTLSEGEFAEEDREKVKTMLDALDAAGKADPTDPYAVYDAAKALAEAYDEVKALK